MYTAFAVDGNADLLSLRTSSGEKFRIASSGELGIGGANYGTAGQVLTSGGSGAAPTWADAGGGGGSFEATADGNITAGETVYLKSTGSVDAVSFDGNVSCSTSSFREQSHVVDDTNSVGMFHD